MATTIHVINITVKNAGLHRNGEKEQKIDDEMKKGEGNGNMLRKCFEWPNKCVRGYDAMECMEVSNKLTRKESTTSVFLSGALSTHYNQK